MMMTRWDFSNKIYIALNNKGAGLGNASIGIIEKTLEDMGVPTAIDLEGGNLCDCDEERVLEKVCPACK